MNTMITFSRRISVGISFLFAVFALAIPMCRADDHSHRCARCGAECATRKVCRAVEEVKKVSKTEFDCECVDFCVPGRSRLCGVEQGCDECGRVTCKRIWEPTCAHVRSKNVLKKKTVEKEEKVTKWVVEELCDVCASACCAATSGDHPAVDLAKPLSAQLVVGDASSDSPGEPIVQPAPYPATSGETNGNTATLAWPSGSK